MTKNFIITGGGTTEKIDAVRGITNTSTGRLSATVCNTLLEKNADDIGKIFYIAPKTSVKPLDNSKIDFSFVTDTQSVIAAIENILQQNKIDVIIHAMAVSDYKADYVSSSDKIAKEISELPNMSTSNIFKVLKQPKDAIKNSKKISSANENLILHLSKTPKIIKLIRELSPNSLLIGFKLLSEVPENELILRGKEFLKQNSCDAIIANDLKNVNEDAHKAAIILKDGTIIKAETKSEIADAILHLSFK